MTKRIKRLNNFLKEHYPDTQAFDSANIAGDDMQKVYDEDGITVLYATFWDYVEIFGVTREEFESVTCEYGISRRTLGGGE